MRCTRSRLLLRYNCANIFLATNWRIVWLSFHWKCTYTWRAVATNHDLPFYWFEILYFNLDNFVENQLFILILMMRFYFDFLCVFFSGFLSMPNWVWYLLRYSCSIHNRDFILLFLVLFLFLCFYWHISICHVYIYGLYGFWSRICSFKKLFIRYYWDDKHRYPFGEYDLRPSENINKNYN